MVQNISFQEFQTFSDARVLVAIGITAVPLLLLGPFSVVGWLISGLVALLLLSVQLRTEVRADGICLRYWPLHRTFRHIPWSDIERCEAVEYDSLQRFGGWGLRVRPGEVAYNVGGRRGVRIRRSGQRSVLIGSESPDEFLAAVEEQVAAE